MGKTDLQECVEGPKKRGQKDVKDTGEDNVELPQNNATLGKKSKVECDWGM